MTGHWTTGQLWVAATLACIAAFAAADTAWRHARTLLRRKGRR